MSNMIPFENAPLPAFLANVVDRGDELSAGSLGFPILSYKGKVWSIRRSGETTQLMRPDDEDTPVSAVDLVILRAGKGLAKTFYNRAYSEGDDAQPDCFSNNGETPDPSVQSPQANSCAACPHNVFGTSVGTDGTGKGKRCQDHKRLAVAAVDALNDPLMLRVPPASLKSLTEFSKLLRTRGVSDPAVVVTKISFDHEVSTPRLKFKPVGFLTQEQYDEAQKMYDSPVVQEIVGLLAVNTPAVQEEAQGTAQKPVAKQEKKVKPAPVVEDVAEEDEEEEAPKQAKRPPAAVVEVPDELEAELDSLLDGFDD